MRRFETHQDARPPAPTPIPRSGQATFSPADEVHEFRGRAPTGVTTEPTYEPGDPKRPLVRRTKSMSSEGELRLATRPAYQRARDYAPLP
mgnify:CR=1 FL=1